MDKFIPALAVMVGFAVVSAALDIVLGIEHPEKKWRQRLHHLPYTILGAALWAALN